jgi:hypothetical protein
MALEGKSEGKGSLGGKYFNRIYIYKKRRRRSMDCVHLLQDDW